MSAYTKILNVFNEKGITDEKSLATTLQRSRESGDHTDQYGVESWDAKDPIAKDFCRALSDAAKELTTHYDTVGGIQQFSLNIEPRINNENVKKALFLSSIATIFTTHQFSYRSENYVAIDDATEYASEYWSISHDFIREIFRYREAVERNKLIILPQSIEMTNSVYGRRNETHLSLLEEIEKTRIFNFNVDERVIDTIVQRYRMSQQLISLPDLSVPWITDLNLHAILQVRDDYGDLVDQFQKAYHKAILAYIENHRSLDFARISQQVNRDLVMPEIEKIEKKYKRILGFHRNLALTGAVVSFIPVAGVIVSDALLNQIFASDVIKLISPTIAGLATSIATNRIHQQNAVKALEDNAFYILWKLKR